MGLTLQTDLVLPFNSVKKNKECMKRNYKQH